MIRNLFAIAALAVAGAVHAADAPQVAKPQCDAAPRAPGRPGDDARLTRHAGAAMGRASSRPA